MERRFVTALYNCDRGGAKAFKRIHCRSSVAIGLASIREHIDHLAAADGVLQPFPVISIVELAMQAGEKPALAMVGEQKTREFLGKYIVRPHRIPGLGRHFILDRKSKRL